VVLGLAGETTVPIFTSVGLMQPKTIVAELLLLYEVKTLSQSFCKNLEHL